MAKKKKGHGTGTGGSIGGYTWMVGATVRKNKKKKN